MWLDEDNKKNEESEDEEEVEAEYQNLLVKKVLDDVSTHDCYGCKLNQRRIGVLIRQVEEKGQHWSRG